MFLASQLAAAPFVAPTEENPPFHRDLLPIDTDTMVSLSDGLTLLSQGIPLETSRERRAAAQALALALALDPANGSARDNISILKEEKELPRPKNSDIVSAKARLWQIYGWLSTPEAGVDGNTLADLIGDTSSVLDSGHPSAIALRESPQSKKWDDWVAPLEQFEGKALAANDPFADIEPDMSAVDPTKDDANSTEIRLAGATVRTVLFQQNLKAKTWSLLPTTVGMKADKKLPENPEGGEIEKTKRREFPIRITSDYGDETLVERSISQPLVALLKSLHGELPERGITLTVGTSESYSFAKNYTNLTGPGFVLADAAITGNAPDATVIGEIDAENKLILPPYFWRLLHELPTASSGGRLVLPASAEPYLTAFLALEMPEFFLKYEVLLAADPAEFAVLCAQKPSEARAAVFTKFAEIRDKAEGNPIGSYLANRYVRQRLSEIAQEAPYHLSAKLLARQGGGERPRTVPKRILAAEIWRILEPINQIIRLDIRSLDADGLALLDGIYEKTRAEVDGLERCTDIRDRDLLGRGRDLTTTVRTLTRAISTRSGDAYTKSETILAAYNQMVVANSAMRQELSVLSGDPLPEDLNQLGIRRKKDK